MTDDEVIIKGLECCQREYDTDCEKCSYNKYSRTGCRGALRKDALDLIKRQKAEIERLEVELCESQKDEIKCGHCIENARIEAVIELMEKIKKRSSSVVMVDADGVEHYETKSYTISATTLDEIVKETAGEVNE